MEGDAVLARDTNTKGHDMKDIPEGWVRVADYDERQKDAHKSSGPKGDYARILWSLKNHPGSINAYQDGREWIARKSDIDAFLSDFHKGKEKPAKPEPNLAIAAHGLDKRHAESVCESLCSIDSTLDEIYRVLERLATAIESIATQPRQAEEQARREIMAACETVNGFHN